jgi:preprotein translocase subunit SecD
VRKNIIIIAAIAGVAGAAGLAAWLIFVPRPALRLVYEIGAPAAGVKKNKQQLIAETTTTFRRRLKAMKMPGIGVESRGQEIHVELPKLEPEVLATIKRVLTKDTHLEFRIVDDASDLPAQIAKALPAGASVEVGQDRYNGKAKMVEYTTLSAASAEALEAMLARLPATLRPPKGRSFLIGKELGSERVKPSYQLYYVEEEAQITGEHVVDAQVHWDEHIARPEVGISFSPEGAKRFASMTKANIGRRLAIILDGRVTSAPVIQSEIPGGRARITHGWNSQDPFTQELEAKEQAAHLRSGTLPAPVTLLRSEGL